MGYHISPNMIVVLKNIAKMLQKHFFLVIITCSNKVPKDLLAFYTVFTYRFLKIDVIGLISAFNGCIKFITKYRPQLIMNVGKPQSLGFVVSITGKLFRTKTLLRFSGDSFSQLYISSGILEKTKKWILHYMMADIACLLSDSILSIGMNISYKIIERGIAEQKITTLPQPFDSSQFYPISSSEREIRKFELGMNPLKKTILFIGRLSWQKGADRLVKVIRCVINNSKKFQFCIIGKGKYENEFKKFSESQVFYLNYVSHENIHLYYQASDLLIFPSRTEGLPNTILEALSCKLPIIASPVGEIPRYVSTLSNNINEICLYILEKEWKVDPTPEHIDLNILKYSYISFLYRIIRDH